MTPAAEESMSGFSKEQVSNVKALLESARRDGCFELLMTAMREESHFSDADSAEFELLSPHSMGASSMTDAAKRRGDELSSEERPMPKQRPLLPKDAGKTSSFPPGIHSLGEWGLTVLTLGKYSKENLTYAELSSDPDKAKQAHCTWMMSQKDRADLSPVFQDFIKYLQMRENVAESSGLYFPGSSIVRKLRQ